MNGKAEDARGTTEKLPNGFPTLKAAETLAFPHRICSEQSRNAVRIVVVVTIGRVPRFQTTDGVDILQRSDALFKLR